MNNIKPYKKEPDIINTLIEVPKGSRNKYELDKELNVYKLDRVLYSSVQYPGDYGHIPNTLWDDGDPLDVLIKVREPSFPGCLIEARIIGILNMQDNGDNDAKILAVPNDDPYYERIKDINDVSPAFLKEVEHFFQVYKQLEPKKEVKVNGWGNKEEAIKAVKKSIINLI
ncbi:MAG: inorganic diphosphatase [Patescibacteria group bacterium]